MPEIAKGAMKISEHKNSKTYRIMCDCTDKDCDLVLDFEMDHDGLIFLNLYQKLIWGTYYHNTTWYERLWTRITKACLILFRGVIEVEGSLVIQDLEHMENFQKVIDEGVEFLKHQQEEYINGCSKDHNKVE